MADERVSDADDSVTVLLPRLRGVRGSDRFISAENLAFEIRQRLGRPVSTSYIQQIEWGKRPASAEILRAIADYFGLNPERFLEYRLAMARRLLDEREVGHEAAAENYADLEAVFPGLSRARQRLIETVSLTEADEAARRIGERVRALVAQDQAAGPRSTSREDPQR